MSVQAGIQKWVRAAGGSVALSLAALPGCPVSAEVERERPNILFIVADDLRNDLGCYGDPLAVAPHLDRLAESGVLFERAYCQQAVCNPSRASMLTGLRPDTLRVWDLRTHFRETLPDVVTLPQHFKNHGYHTRSIGKVFHNDTRRAENRPSMADPVSWSVPPLLSIGGHWEDWVVPDDPFGPPRKAESLQILDVPDEAYFDGQVAALAVAAIKDLSESEAPFFLAVGFWKPHLPFNAPRRYWDLYERESFFPGEGRDAAAGMPALAKHTWHELRTYTDIPAEGPLSDDLTALLRHGYYACISFLDAQVGKILEQLRLSGLADNTIIIFVSDHGFHLGEGNLWGKTSVYELDARVPLLFSVPGMGRGGTRSSAIVELIDLYPTLVDLAALPMPETLEGQSLRPQLKDSAAPGRPVALTQGPQPYYTRSWEAMGYGMRTERFRYIEWRCLASGSILERELYDHATDPTESVNVIKHPEYAAFVRALEALARESYTFDHKWHAPSP